MQQLCNVSSLIFRLNQIPSKVQIKKVFLHPENASLSIYVYFTFSVYSKASSYVLTAKRFKVLMNLGEMVSRSKT